MHLNSLCGQGWCLVSESLERGETQPGITLPPRDLIEDTFVCLIALQSIAAVGCSKWNLGCVGLAMPDNRRE